MLPVRLIGVRDYNVHDDGQRIGRIRSGSERSPGNRRRRAVVVFDCRPRSRFCHSHHEE
jgi:hypothetical protein